ncbi:MAG TPA: type I methionyl aminopeptidase [Deltaproteobacteria bacterium]|nr:type I methionyl aminopeptidase [Deltaproteobacteria bacterium]
MITLKSKDEVVKIHRAGQVVAETILRVAEAVKPGVTTLDLDRIAEEFILSQGLKPAFKGYLGFRHTLCLSVNEEVVHGIPSKKRVLKEGDIIGIDCGAIYEGFYGDSARTLACGTISPQVQNLLEVTRESLNQGIAQMQPSRRLYDIGAAIQAHAEAQGMSIVKEYVGHGIGRALHEDPQVPNYGTPGTGMRLKVGMVLALEPMVNLGAAETYMLEDGWTVVTKDGSLSAHFEDTIVITENGPEILTRIE